jgi:hypothetical protein
MGLHDLLQGQLYFAPDNTTLLSGGNEQSKPGLKLLRTLVKIMVGVVTYRQRTTDKTLGSPEDRVNKPT